MKDQEIVRFIIGLRRLGVKDSDITNLLLWISTGEEQYAPAIKN